MIGLLEWRNKKIKLQIIFLILKLGCELLPAGKASPRSPARPVLLGGMLKARNLRLRGGSGAPEKDLADEEDNLGVEHFENLEEGYEIDCAEDLDKEVRVGWAPMDEVSVRVIPAEEGCLLGSDGKGWHGPIAEWFPSTLGECSNSPNNLVVHASVDSHMKSQKHFC